MFAIDRTAKSNSDIILFKTIQIHDTYHHLFLSYKPHIHILGKDNVESKLETNST